VILHVQQVAEMIRETAKPVLGICGGHQLIGMLLGDCRQQRPTLFDGRLVVKQAHFWQLVSLPDCLYSIARNDNCPRASVAPPRYVHLRRSVPPEFQDEDHTDGRRLLETFFSLAKLR
jgi:hypothetical protein